MVLAAAAALAGGAAFRMNDLRLQTVLSGSMEPTVAAGDVAVTQPVPVASLAVGDIIVVFPPGNAIARMHRIVSIGDDNGRVMVTTKGDANRVADPQIILQGTTAFRMVASIPYVGWLTQVKGPLLIASGLLVALVLIRELVKKEKPRPQP